MRRRHSAPEPVLPPEPPTVPAPEVPDDHPYIVVGPDEHRVLDEANAALARAPDVYTRGGALVRVVREAARARSITRPAGAPRIVAMQTPGTRIVLGREATWVSEDADGGQIEIAPPTIIVQACLGNGEWPGVRQLEAVIAAPVMRADGSIVSEPGFDDETGVLFAPDAQFLVVPDAPTRAQAKQALAELVEVVCDFPFAEPVYQFAWVAAAVTPFARYAFDGCVPITVVDKTTRGCGGSLAVDVASIISSGRPAARTTSSDDDSEWRKKITSIAQAGDPLVLIDNVEGVLGCPSLNAALTGTVWSDRLLGRNEMIRLPLLAQWWATGNNIQVEPDTVRRALPVRLASPLENPEDRSDFRHPQLLKWTLSERPRLVRAALTLLKAYVAARRPVVPLKNWGSFEDWSSLVRGAIVYAGGLDPADAREELRSRGDTEANALRVLIQELGKLDPHGHGLSAGDIVQALGGDDENFLPKLSALRSAVETLCPGPPGRAVSARSLGNRLRRMRGRVVGGQAIDSRETNMGALWQVVDVRGSRGSRGSTEHSLEKNSERDPNLPEGLEEPLEPVEPLARGGRVVHAHFPRGAAALPKRGGER